MFAAEKSAIYVYDPDCRIWNRKESDSHFKYSSGEKVEEYIANVLSRTTDLATGSCALRNAIRDWPTLIHFSNIRANLLRPIEKLLTGSILEVGAGCGAITRYLGECAAAVTAVEGSRRRAIIAASRCRDLPNVEVYCDNLETFQTSAKFDVVTLIGVLEYSRRYLDAENPIHQMLSYCHNLLKPTGLLIIAIENQLGLKYFAGAPEDHFMSPYHGVMDLYKAKSTVTFGRQELALRLQKSGFAHAHFLYPLPDYKLPRIVLNDAAFEEHLDFLGLLQAVHRAYDNADRPFAEEMTWPVLVRNGLAQDFMNSFLVIASKSEPPALDPADRVHFYASERHPAFEKVTQIRHETSGLVVRRKKLYKEHKSRDGKYRQVLEDEPFLVGELYVNELVRIVNRTGWTAKDIAVWAKPWLSFLLTEARSTNERENAGWHNGNDPLLPGRFLDCAPFNVVKLPDNTLRTFDLEFVAEDPLPFSFVAFRGLYWSLIKRVTVAQGKGTSRITRLISQVMKLSGFPLSRRQIRNAISREIEFREFVKRVSMRPVSRTRQKISRARKTLSMYRRRLPMRVKTKRMVLPRKIVNRLTRILRTTLKRFFQ